MPISLRAAALRAALERALGEPVRPLATERGIRLYAVVSPNRSWSTWANVLVALSSASRWGSTSSSGTAEIWAEVDDEVRP